MTESTAKKAVWKPSWYELDQSLEISAEQKFWFFQGLPAEDWTTDFVDSIDLVFFNQLDPTCKSEVRFGEVREIFHQVLGPLKKVDADGLDYVFTLANDEEIVVNAEEEPGQTYEEGLQIHDWSVLVTLINVSEPVSDSI